MRDAVLNELFETLTLRAGRNTTLVIAGTTLLGLAAGIVGVFALLRKRSLVADALSHAALPGIAGAFLVMTLLGLDARAIPPLLAGAIITGVLSVWCIRAITRHTRLREDAAIGIALSLFFGVGVVLLSVIQNTSPTGSAGLTAFIYGQAATMQPGDVALMASLACVAVISAFLLVKEFALVCFNDDFARVTGWPVSRLDLVMMALVTLVTVAGMQAVGLILVVSLLIIPPVAARFWSERLRTMLVISGLIGGASAYAGAVTSAMLPDKPAGAVIVLCTGVAFVVSLLFAPKRGVLATALRQWRIRLRIAGDHLLEAASEHSDQRLDRAQVRALARLRGWSRPFRHSLLVSLQRRWAIRTLPGGVIELTSVGRKLGARIARNHALWEQYLTSYADVAPSHVDWTVDQVEHVLSNDLVRELEAELDR
ncbi:MAG: iron chelate uptake ABC transporter family permease subunit [Planctomycetota bacterium]